MSCGANYVREAGSLLRYMEAKCGETTPLGSYGMVVTPQERVEPTAVKIAEDHLYRTQPAVVKDVFDRVVRAWRMLRAQGGDLDATYTIFRTERALPSQWRAELQADRLVRADE